MASTASKAIRKQTATERLRTAAEEIALRQGIDPPVFGKRNQDAELAHVQDLEAIAQFLESISNRLQPTKGGQKGGKEKEAR